MKSRRELFVPILLILVACLAFAENAVPSVEGHLTLAGKKVALIGGTAIEEGDHLTIVLTDRPLNSESLSNEAQRREQWLKTGMQGLEARVYNDKTVNSDADVFHSLLKGSAWITDPVIEITNRTADRVSGTVRTEVPGDFFGKRYTILATFDFKIQTRGQP